MRRFIAVTVTATTLLLQGSAYGWGEQGHRITGLVAQRLLTPQASAGIKALMGKTDLATVALYMDQNKLALDKKVPGSREWHYDDRPVCDEQAAKASYCPDGNCASNQVTRAYRRLIDAHSSADDKRFALYTLVHLVGDVHQPLHASDHEDRGGNDVKLSFTLPTGQKRTTNLHSAWDTDFVKAAFTSSDERVIAQQLFSRYGASMDAWQRGSVSKWLAESYQIAQTMAYGQLPAFQCSDEDFGKTKLVLDSAYVADALELVPQQLAKSGARIAYLLNRAFAD